jgi:hypothetical protein
LENPEFQISIFRLISPFVLSALIVEDYQVILPKALPCFQQQFYLSPFRRFTSIQNSCRTVAQVSAFHALLLQQRRKEYKMKLFTIAQNEKLLENASPERYGKDHVPVVKLFLPLTNCTWLLTDIDPECHNIAFGLCDLGIGFPELGTVDLEELMSIRVALVFSIERDLFFKGKYPISVYARAASHFRAIVEDETILERFVRK